MGLASKGSSGKRLRFGTAPADRRLGGWPCWKSSGSFRERPPGVLLKDCLEHLDFDRCWVRPKHENDKSRMCCDRIPMLKHATGRPAFVATILLVLPHQRDPRTAAAQ